MSYTNEFINEVKRATDLVALVKEEVKDLKKSGKYVWTGSCPHPDHSDSTPSFTVWENTQKWTCFGCKDGRADDCIGYVMWLHGFTFQEAIQYLAAKAGIAIEDDALTNKYNALEKECVKYQKAINEEAMAYFTSRGIDQKDISDYRLGYDTKSKRIVFPLINKYNKVVGFITRRTIEEGSPKYKNSPASEVFNKSTYLYNCNNLDKDFKYIRIVEGTMDVIIPSKYGAKNVVATLGTALTQEHIDEIKKLDMTPVLIYDSDNAGLKATSRALELFYKNGIYCKICPIRGNKDLCDEALEITTDIEDFIANNSITYGYAMAKDIINSYTKDIYEIRLKYSKKINTIAEKIPEEEKEAINSFLRDEIKMQI